MPICMFYEEVYTELNADARLFARDFYFRNSAEQVKDFLVTIAEKQKTRAETLVLKRFRSRKERKKR